MNERAHRFFASNGFRLEGHLRDARYIDGGWSDILIFGRIRGEEQGS
jgi:RimJ/RimL family protein N-acetyltransferase